MLVRSEKRWILLLALVCVPQLLALLSAERLEWLGREDGLIEYMGAALFLIAAGVTGTAAVRGSRRGTLPRARVIVLWLVALLFVYACGEEISWGQRIIGFATPEWLDEYNYQGEFTLHNIGATEEQKGTLFYYLDQFPIPSSTFALGVVFLALPLFHGYWPWARRLMDRFGVPVFSLGLGVVWVISYLLLKVAEMYTGGQVGYDPNWVREIWETTSAGLLVEASIGQLRLASGQDT